MNIQDKKDILLPSLYEFFKKNDNINIMLPIILGSSKISISALDWFVTNYAKDKKILYTIGDNKQFNVHLDYKSQLKGYKKKFFDPFCRKKRIPFYYSDTEYVITTIGQLNFFRWAILNGIINYVNNNLILINRDMNRKKEFITSDNITNNSSLINASSQSESKLINENTEKTVKCSNIEINFDIY